MKSNVQILIGIIVRKASFCLAVCCAAALLIAALIVTAAQAAPGNIIVTVAGRDSFGDGGQGADAQVAAPGGVFKHGTDLYIADTNHHRIRKLDTTTGVITTVAGNGTSGYSGDNGPAASASLNSPSSVAVDASGNIYISDTNNHRIREVLATNGTITTVAGNGTAGYLGDNGPATSARINSPQGLALDVSGNIYIADANNHRIREVLVSSGTITTVAGKIGSGYTGDNGPATSATLYYPRGVAVDTAGNIYIADTSDHRVREVLVSTGTITTVAGNGTGGYSGDDGFATSASLNYPRGVAVDGSGNIYIADTNNHRIREVLATNGTITTVAGSATPGYAGDNADATSARLNAPYGIAIDASGNIYVADTGNNRIREVLSTNSTIISVAGNGTYGYFGDGGVATSANLWNPNGLAIDASGNIFIADTSNYRIREVLVSSGIITTVAGNGVQGSGGDNGPAISASLNYPRGVAVDASGNVYIADPNNQRVRKVLATSGTITAFAGNGTSGYAGDNGPAASANLNNPYGVAHDAEGNIYIADYANHRIRKVLVSSGTITTVAGNGSGQYAGDDAAATSASLNYPKGVAVDGSGNIYIADTLNHRIRKVLASSGTITTVAGNGSWGYSGDGGAATSAQLYGPDGVAVDTSGNIYIADTLNNRIREVLVSDGTITTIAGNGVAAFAGDNGAATSASLNNPSGVAVDAAGNVFIADTGNSRIRKIEMVGLTPPSPPGTPTDAGAYSTSTSITFNWTQAQDNESGIASYNIQVGTTQGGSEIYSGNTGTALSYTATGANGQTLYAKAQAVNGAGIAGSWTGNSDGITIDTTAPILNSSAEGTGSQLYIWFSEAVNGALDAANYSADNGLVINGVDKPDGICCALLTSHQEPGIQYTVTANTANITDRAGNPLSSTAHTATFTRSVSLNIAPTIPTLNSPLSSSETTTQTPVLAVNASTDEDNDTVSYVFEIDTSSAFNSGNKQSSGVIGSVTWTPSTLIDNTVWYWRVQATDGLSNSTWMSTASFFVNTANDAPTAPGISAPALSSQVTSTTPLLAVTNASDVDNDVLAYEFEVYLNGNFTGSVASATGISQGGGGTTTWTVAPALTEDTTYYWRARARDEHNLAGAYASGSFRVNTANAAPTDPIPSSPDADSETTNTTPVLTVTNATDGDGDSLVYVFEIDTVEAFNSPNKQTSGPVVGGAGSTSWTPATPLTDNTWWCWRVKASDGVADSYWSTETCLFVNTGNDAPGTPTLQAPADNSEVTVLSPNLAVTASDPDYDALTYDFRIYSDSGLTSLITGTTGIPAGFKIEPGWTVVSGLVDNAKYWWTARSVDAHGLASPWMAAASFFVNNNGVNDPPTLSMTKPAAQEPTVTGNSFTITWTDSDPDSNATIELGYDTSGSGCSGTQIAAGISENDMSNSYTWNLTGVANGSYRVYGIISDGTSTLCSYATGTLVKMSAPLVVTPSAGTGGSISPNTGQAVASGSTATFTVTADAGYTLDQVTGCNGSLAGNTYTTGPVNANCTVTASFTANPVNGTCGTANGQTFAVAPATNLCAAGSPGTVSGSGLWAWNCAGANGGTTASCSANLQASIDTTPDAFAFIDQTGAALNTVITSNIVTVTGINAAATIGVTGGEYKINSGSWTFVAGTVNKGETVTVRHTSSASYSTAVNTVLTIGGVSDTFTSTTVSAPASNNTTPDGDLDGSGVSATDALKALRISAGLDTSTTSDLQKGDVAPLINGKPAPDGRIDVGDVVVILRKAVGLVSW